MGAESGVHDHGPGSCVAFNWLGWWDGCITWIAKGWAMRNTNEMELYQQTDEHKGRRRDDT